MRERVIEWLRSRGVEEVGEELAARLHVEFAGASARLLRRAAIESGLRLTPMVEGVRQETLENLERTLVALAAEYEAGDAARKGQVRALVIEARRHASFAAKRKPKDEELLWMRVWLENPPLFEEWLKLRKMACGERGDAV